MTPLAVDDLPFFGLPSGGERSGVLFGPLMLWGRKVSAMFFTYETLNLNQLATSSKPFATRKINLFWVALNRLK